MKHRLHIWIIGLAMMSLGAACAWAKQVTPEQAGQAAVRFMTERHSAIQKMPNKAPATGAWDEKAALEWEAKAVLDAKDKTGAPYLYAVRFAQKDGYVIVSGDDRFAEVLGYSESGSWDEAQMPDNMRAWLQEYINEMRYWDSVGYEPSGVRTQPSEIRNQMSAIAPLIETRWNQGSPFNELCPLDNNDLRSVTGCVATAMAQVVNYYMQHYNAPTTIIADIPAYTTQAHSLSVAGVEAGTALPDRSLLLNTYGSTATDEQKTAVARLMLYCGTAVKMNYTSGSSSASSSNVPNALINYFGFDATTRYEYRTAYTYAGWQETIHNELSAARPVYYRGSSSGGGHAFIVDGYDGNGLFHINWGWGGSSDDYFALSVLNPDDDSQIGASLSSDGYTGGQAAIFGVQINTGETYDRPICLSISNLRAKGDTAIFAAYNYTGETNSFNSGIGFIDASGNITKIDSKKHTDLRNSYGYSSLKFIVPTNKSYANQTKKIVPISRKYTVLGLGKWYTGANPDLFYFIVRYDANGNPAVTAHPTQELRVDSMYVTTYRYLNESQSVKVQVTNNGDEYYGNVYLFATLADTVAEPEAEMGLTALENSTQTISFKWYPVETGTYRLVLASDKKGENVLHETNVVIREDASLQNKTLAIMGYSFENEDRSTFTVDEATGIRSMDVYGDSLIGRINVKNLTSTKLSNYQVKVLVEKYDPVTGKFITGTWNSYFTLTILPGGSTNLKVQRKLEVGNTYRICVVLRNSPSTYLDDRYVVHMRATKPETTDFEQIHQEPAIKSRKLMIDGQLIILRDGRQYTVQGQLIR